MRTNRLGAALAAVVVAAGAPMIIARTASAATTTQSVTPNNLNGWMLSSAGSESGASTTFVSETEFGPNSPEGFGSLRFLTGPGDGTAGGERRVMTDAYDGVRMEDFEVLRYATYIAARQGGTDVAPAFRIILENLSPIPNPDSAEPEPAPMSATIIFEPVYQTHLVTPPETSPDREGVWQTWSLLGAAKWWSFEEINGMPAQTKRSWDEIKAANPLARVAVASNDLGFGSVTGDTSAQGPWHGFDGNIDAVAVKHKERAAPPPPAISARDDLWDFNAAPIVTSTQPTALGRGRTDYEREVTLTGAHMHPGAIVTFSGTGVTAGPTVSSNGGNTLTFPVTVKRDAPIGPRTMTITNTDKSAGTRQFELRAGPAVDSVSPNSLLTGSSNTPVTVNGSGFEQGALVSFVPTSGVTVSNTQFVSSSRLIATVSVASGTATGQRDVMVTNPDSGQGFLPAGMRIAAPANTAGGVSETPSPSVSASSSASSTPSASSNPSATSSVTATATASVNATASASSSTASPSSSQPAGRVASSVVLSSSHSRITAGNTPVLSGQVLDASGQPVGGAGVVILEKSFGEFAYSTTARVVSGADGRFSLVVRPPNQTSYGANTEDGRANSNIVQLRVNARMDINSPAPNSLVSNPVTLSGRLTPAYNARPIGLAYINNAGRYVYLGQRNSVNGTWTVTAGTRVPAGTYTFVVYMSPTQGTDKGARSVRLTVR